MRFCVLYLLDNSRGSAIADSKFEGIRSYNDVIGGDDDYSPISRTNFRSLPPVWKPQLPSLRRFAG